MKYSFFSNLFIYSCTPTPQQTPFAKSYKFDVHAFSFYFYFFKIVFTYMRESTSRGRSRGAEGQREAGFLAGLCLGTLGSWPRPKADAWASQAPRAHTLVAIRCGTLPDSPWLLLCSREHSQLQTLPATPCVAFRGPAGLCFCCHLSLSFLIYLLIAFTVGCWCRSVLLNFQLFEGFLVIFSLTGF